jgi:hypothetical protein
MLSLFIFPHPSLSPGVDLDVTICSASKGRLFDNAKI